MEITKQKDGTLSINKIELTEGKQSASGKSVVLFTERKKDKDGMTVQITIYKSTKPATA